MTYCLGAFSDPNHSPSFHKETVKATMARTFTPDHSLTLQHTVGSQYAVVEYVTKGMID